MLERYKSPISMVKWAREKEIMTMINLMIPGVGAVQESHLGGEVGSGELPSRSL